jgi:4-hydroxybenzoate polyprenyltransferase
MALKKLKTYGELVMFSHTLFSLPFGLIAMFWAADKGLPSFEVFLWIFLALFGARNGANALNRIVDRKIDAKNPRTAGRHMPLGLVKDYEAMLIVAICFTVLAISAYMLNPLCLKLLPFALVIFGLYSFTKRFTWACHIILGVACGGAPVGAWIAVKGEIGWPSIVLGAIVTLWVAGFDIIYATQDVDFDRSQGLYSIPSFFGIGKALLISSAFHFAVIAMLGYLYFYMNMGYVYLVGVLIISVLIIMEHLMVRPNNLRNVKVASFSVNQIVSVLLLIFTSLDMIL